MQAWFISDLHLRNINERNSVILLRFLHSLLKDDNATHLFLLGDIFDLWVGDSDVFQSKFQAIVDALADLKRRGVEVNYFEGNHDVHIRDFWQKRLGISVFVDHQIFELGPYRVRMEHGDYINPDDLAYMRYLSVIRHPQVAQVAQMIPGRVWNEVGQAASKLSRRFSSKRRSDAGGKLREMIRAYAQAKVKETAFDYIVTGHMHVRDEFEFEVGGQKRVSINLGSWFERPRALLITGQGHSWKDL
jgi:UDP-2,3-diacylglucosamine hydrolase